MRIIVLIRLDVDFSHPICDMTVGAMAIETSYIMVITFRTLKIIQLDPQQLEKIINVPKVDIEIAHGYLPANHHNLRFQ